jgi:antitoxin (DNA-binding transcriptional repressor) of toxin-antitoxin stability system
VESIINAKTLRAELAATLERVRKGERITVIYRSQAVCRLVPIEAAEQPLGPPAEDSLYGAGAVGRSNDGLSASEHDAVLYGASRR